MMKFTVYFATIVTALSFAALCCDAGAKAANPEIIAHRGASYYHPNPAVTSGTLYAPENTVASNRLAWEMGADAVECDVYLTADKRVVVIHDRNTSRTTAGKLCLDVTKSKSEDIRRADVGSWYAPRYAGEKVPFLEEIVALVPPGKRLYVEIECGAEMVEPVREIFDKFGKRSQMAIIGFGLETMKAFAAAMPDVPVYYISSKTTDAATGKVVPHSMDYIKNAREGKLSGIDLECYGYTKEYCDAAKAAGLDVLAWTTDEPAEAKRLVEIGVRGITTNRCDLMLDVLGRKGCK